MADKRPMKTIQQLIGEIVGADATRRPGRIEPGYLVNPAKRPTLQQIVEEVVASANLPAARAGEGGPAVDSAGTNNTNIHVTGLSGGLHIHIHVHPPRDVE